MATQTNNTIQSTQVSKGSENVSDQTVTAQFSNWYSQLSDVRKRYWDQNSQNWYWKIEDVTDADTVNINQLDVSLQPNQSVEIRISAISEVGWPDSILESDWSNTLTVVFPDDLINFNSNLDDAYSAAQDQALIEMNNTLTTKGVYKHIDDQFYDNNNIIYKHRDVNIETSFKDNKNNTLNLLEYLTSLTDRIATLEEMITKVKGELKIYLYKNNTLIKEIVNNTNTNIKVELEDYVTSLSGSTRTYANNLYMIDDYSILLSNVSQNGVLGLLSSRLYISGGTNIFYNDILNQSLLIDYNDDLYTQQNNQFVWFFDKDNQTNIYTGLTSATNPNSAFLLNSQNFNIGASGMTQLYTPWNNINTINWKNTGTNLLATVHPYFPDVTTLIESGQDKTKNINSQSNFSIGMKIYFKLDGSNDFGSSFKVASAAHYIKTRKVKVYFETNDGLSYQFMVTFSLSNYRLYFTSTAQSNTGSGTSSNNSSF